jgi:hypothetical protein
VNCTAKNVLPRIDNAALPLRFRRLVPQQKLLDAAVRVIRSKGYSAARVEDIVAEAGLTKAPPRSRLRRISRQR